MREYYAKVMSYVCACARAEIAVCVTFLPLVQSFPQFLIVTIMIITVFVICVSLVVCFC